MGTVSGILISMVESGSGSALNSFLSQIETASWLANFVGTMVGVAIGGLVVLFVLRRQLQSDRELFKEQSTNANTLFAQQSENDRKLFAQQSENDRNLFKDMLEAQRDNERRLRRREVAVELATRLKPAGDRLSSIRSLDFRAAEWPDYISSCDTLKSLETLLWSMACTNFSVRHTQFLIPVTRPGGALTARRSR